MDAIWREMAPYGILDAGSGRQILADIIEFMRAMLYATSLVAVLNMLIASLGVANVIINSVEQRRYELGVLRAVGGHRGMLARMVAAEAVLIAIAAGPLLPILAGCGIVLVICLLASVPAVLRLNRMRPRELLSSRS